MGQVLSQTLRTMTGLSRNIQMCIFIIFRPHKWGRKIMIRDAFLVGAFRRKTQTIVVTSFFFKTNEVTDFIKSYK